MYATGSMKSTTQSKEIAVFWEQALKADRRALLKTVSMLLSSRSSISTIGDLTSSDTELMCDGQPTKPLIP